MKSAMLLTGILALSSICFAKSATIEDKYNASVSSAADQSFSQKAERAVRTKGCKGAFVGGIEYGANIGTYFVETSDCLCMYYETPGPIDEGGNMSPNYKANCLKK